MNNIQTQSEVVILTSTQLKNLVSQIIEEAKNQPKPEKEEEIYLTTAEAQKFLKVGRSTIHRYIRIGKLKPVRFGRKLLFRKSELLKESKS